jgi:hypothetical protein
MSGYGREVLSARPSVNPQRREAGRARQRSALDPDGNLHATRSIVPMGIAGTVIAYSHRKPWCVNLSSINPQTRGLYRRVYVILEGDDMLIRDIAWKVLYWRELIIGMFISQDDGVEPL